MFVNHVMCHEKESAMKTEEKEKDEEEGAEHHANLKQAVDKTKVAKLVVD